MFTVKVRVRYRNPLRHGIRGETIYRVVIAVPSAPEAKTAAAARLKAWFAPKYPHLEVSSCVGVSAAATPEEKVEVLKEESVRPY